MPPQVAQTGEPQRPLYCTLLYSTLLYSTLHYSTLLCSTLLDSVLFYTTIIYTRRLQLLYLSMQTTAKALSPDTSRPPRTVVEVFVRQLSVPTKVAHTDGPHRIATVCINEVFVTQLSVPPMVAQTFEP